MNPIRHIVLSTVLLTAAAVAGAAPPAGPGRGAGRIPSAEALATIPGLTLAQQQGIRRIAIEQRDAHEALRVKERAEHERIDERGDESVRKLLGEDGFRQYAEWKQSHRRAAMAAAHDHGPRGEGRRGRGRDHDRSDAKPTPPAPAVAK